MTSINNINKVMIIIAFTECLLVADAELFHLPFTTTLCIEYSFYAHFTDEATGTLSKSIVTHQERQS